MTPGGLGVVEASLAALLVAPGTSDDVLAASVIGYRLISYWLVVVGVVALVAERTQSGRARRHKAAAAQAGKPVKTPPPAAASKA